MALADHLPGQAPALREKGAGGALDWTLDLLFPKDFVQFLTVRGAVMPDLPFDSAPEPAGSAMMVR